MKELLMKTVKSTLIEYLEKARAGAPATIAMVVAKLVAWLPASIEKATSSFKGVYSDITTRVGAWLPTTIPALTKASGSAADWLKVRIAKL